MIDKDDLDRTEDYMELPSDNKKVVDVVKVFDEMGSDAAIKKTMDLMQKRRKDREEREKNRNVRSIGFRLTPPNPEDTSDYYTSYSDHLCKLDKEIENQKALIIAGIERLELLIEKEALITEEANALTSETFVLPKQYQTGNEHFDALIKEHILHKHPKIVGDYFGEYRYSSHAGPLHLESIYDKDGKLVKVRCLDCYYKWIRSNVNGSPSKDDGELDAYDKPGAK